MKYRILTFAVLGFCAAIIIALDIFLAAKHGSGAETISTLTLNAVRSHPWAFALLFFALGFLTGHLSWPQVRPP